MATLAIKSRKQALDGPAQSGQLLLLREGNVIAVSATQASRLVVLGGEPMDGPRHIWWNSVSSRKDAAAGAAVADRVARPSNPA